MGEKKTDLIDLDEILARAAERKAGRREGCAFCKLPKEAHEDLRKILDSCLLTSQEGWAYFAEKYDYGMGRDALMRHVWQCQGERWPRTSVSGR